MRIYCTPASQSTLASFPSLLAEDGVDSYPGSRDRLVMPWEGPLLASLSHEAAAMGESNPEGVLLQAAMARICLLPSTCKPEPRHHGEHLCI